MSDRQRTEWVAKVLLEGRAAVQAVRRRQEVVEAASEVDGWAGQPPAHVTGDEGMSASMDRDGTVKAPCGSGVCYLCTW